MPVLDFLRFDYVIEYDKNIPLIFMVSLIYTIKMCDYHAHSNVALHNITEVKIPVGERKYVLMSAIACSGAAVLIVLCCVIIHMAFLLTCKDTYIFHHAKSLICSLFHYSSYFEVMWVIEYFFYIRGSLCFQSY